MGLYGVKSLKAKGALLTLVRKHIPAEEMGLAPALLLTHFLHIRGLVAMTWHGAASP
jgi:hypothetical protein